MKKAAWPKLTASAPCGAVQHVQWLLRLQKCCMLFVCVGLLWLTNSNILKWMFFYSDSQCVESLGRWLEISLSTLRLQRPFSDFWYMLLCNITALKTEMKWCHIQLLSESWGQGGRISLMNHKALSLDCDCFEKRKWRRWLVKRFRRVYVETPPDDVEIIHTEKKETRHFGLFEL